MKKYSHFVWITFLVFGFNIAPIFAQDEEQKSSKKEKQTIKKKVTQAQNKVKPFYLIKTDIRMGWNSNVFKTPSGQYVDPETGALRISAPTGSYFFNPDLELALLPHNGKRSKFEIAYSWEGIFYPAGGAVGNANGYRQKLQAEYEFDFVNKNLQEESKNPIIEKSSIGLKVYRQQAKYNYLHRGTGELRNTKISKIDEENRYRHWESAAVLDFKNRFSSGTKIALSVGSFDRDYEDITSLQSYDRKEFETKVEGEQEFGVGWSVFADWSKIKLQYDRHRASNTTGTSVPGTTRTFNDSEINGGLEYDHDSVEAKLKYAVTKREDIYAGYWSYDQNKSSIMLAKQWPAIGRFKIEGSQESRRYKLETNTFGVIRNFKSDEIEVGWDRDFGWGTLSAKVSQLTQVDTDTYYSYKNSVGYIGFEKDF